jgi:hypothetical protein
MGGLLEAKWLKMVVGISSFVFAILDLTAHAPSARLPDKGYCGCKSWLLGIYDAECRGFSVKMQSLHYSESRHHILSPNRGMARLIWDTVEWKPTCRT